MLRACECAMNSYSLDLNANVRRVGGWVDTGHSLLDGPLSEWVGGEYSLCPAMNLQLNLIALLTVVNKMPGIQFDWIQLKLICTLSSSLFTLLSSLSPFHCPLDVTLCIHTFFAEQWNNLKCLWYSEISAACWMKFKSNHAPNRRRCAPPIATPMQRRVQHRTAQSSAAAHRIVTVCGVFN